jgi:MATE family multidrug resistance protein
MNAFALLNPRPSQALTPWRRETFALVRLAVPLVLTELSYMAMVTTDIVMMGWLGPQSLAAGSLSGHLYAFLEFFALGVIAAVAPVLAQHLGAGRYRMIRRTVRQGFWVAVAIAVPCIIVIWQARAIFMFLGQDPDIATAGQAYLRAMVVAFIPGLWLLVLSEFLAAHARPRATLVVAILGIAINGLADYALIFGNFGFPRLEIVGAGVATSIVTSFMFFGLLGFVLIDRRLRRYRLLGRFWRADWPQFLEILRIGIPIGVIHLAEIGMFLASALIMGLLGTTALAAHAIAIECVSVTYMMPLGISQAATIRVGRAVGAGDHRTAARAGWIGVFLGIGFACLSAAALWFYGGPIAGLFLDASQPENQAAIALAVSFLAIAALFQVVEAIMATSLGALRGMKDTRGPMIIALTGYWGIGLPSAVLFAIYLDFGGQAVWGSLVAALTVLGALLLQRFWRRSLAAIRKSGQLG